MCRIQTGMITLLLAFLTPFLSYAHTQQLPLNKAFQFTAAAKDYQTVVLFWDIAPGYYLYKDRFKIRAVHANSIRLAQPVLPQDWHEKKFGSLGKYAVYNGKIYIIQPIINSNNTTITLQVSYQGCSDKGFCYPPISKVVTLNLSGDYMTPVPGVDMDVAPQSPQHTPTSITLNPQQHIAKMLSTKNWWGIVIGFFVFGVLISFTPCVLPMIPILSSIIVGHGKISHAKSFLLSLLYVLGMALTYAVAGILFGFIGSSIQADFQQPWLISIFVAIFILMALSLFDLFDIQLPEIWRAKLADLSNHQKRGTYFGVVLMGVFSTLILSPCVTPPLVGVLAYISQSGDAAIGGIALFIMGIGMGLPLLLIGAFGPKLLPHTGKWMVVVKHFMGLLMLAVAIWMLSRIIPELVTMLLWGLLILGSGVSLGALSSSQGHWQHIRKAIGLCLFIYGIVIIIGASLGNSNPFEPFEKQRYVSTEQLPFITVTSVATVSHEMNLPQHKNKRVLLDFYASWCVSCKEMDDITFSNPHVQAALKSFVLLRADVTKNDARAKQLLLHFSVVAPPTLIVFNKQHHEITQARMVGMVHPNVLLQRLKGVRRLLHGTDSISPGNS